MATVNDSFLSEHAVPDSDAPTAPYPPSPAEAKLYYYGIPSKPRLVARSSTDVWAEPRGPEAYFIPKEARPLGFHPLREIWEATVAPAMVSYLDAEGVKWTSLDPVRMGYTDDPSPPAIIWVGVLPGSLTAEIGIRVATHCKGILSAHGIRDIDIEIRESEVFLSAKMYKPPAISNATLCVREPFPTTLGLSIGGTGGFFISDPRYPGKIYLVTARHAVIHPDEDRNELYQQGNSSQPPRKVSLFSDPAIEKRIAVIEFEIGGHEIAVEYLGRRLEAAEQLGVEDAEVERNEVQSQLKKARKAIGDLKTFLADVSRDWKERKNRVLGHVVLSPAISFNVGEEGFTEDWAVIEIDKFKVDSTNFVGNAIAITADEFTSGMCPSPANLSLFKYPVDRLFKFYGTIPDEEMWKPDTKTCDYENNPVIMVIKSGGASGFTVGCLNTVRSFTRYCFKGEAGKVSKEVAVLPRDYKSGAFSQPGDSGSCVVDCKGRLAGLLTGGAGVVDESDCTYITSIDFVHKRMLLYGLEANFFPSSNA